jgi:hypothetical protein
MSEADFLDCMAERTLSQSHTGPFHLEPTGPYLPIARLSSAAASSQNRPVESAAGSHCIETAQGRSYHRDGLAAEMLDVACIGTKLKSSQGTKKVSCHQATLTDNRCQHLTHMNVTEMHLSCRD